VFPSYLGYEIWSQKTRVHWLYFGGENYAIVWSSVCSQYQRVLTDRQTDKRTCGLSLCRATKTNAPMLMQISTNGPQLRQGNKTINFGVSRSKVKVTGGRR